MEDKKQANWRRLIRKAANFLKKNNWHKANLARIVNPQTGSATSCRVFDPHANSFCMLGALAKVSNEAKFPNRYGDLGSQISDVLYNVGERNSSLPKDPTLRKALIEIYEASQVKPLYRLNDFVWGSKEDVIENLLRIANK